MQQFPVNTFIDVPFPATAFLTFGAAESEAENGREEEEERGGVHCRSVWVLWGCVAVACAVQSVYGSIVTSFGT